MDFRSPVPVIHSPESLDYFLESETCKSITKFVHDMGDSVLSKPNSVDCPASDTSLAILDCLKRVEQLLDETPAVPTASRFGNPAFRTFYDKIEEQAETLMRRVLPERLAAAAVEISGYFVHCFGDRQRIDYGSGHELNFVMCLYCFERLGLLGPQDYTFLVTRVFANGYLAIMRRVQQQYWLEPAGSHGVWGLDDYQFLPFLFGAAQLVGHKHIRPRSITSAEVLEGFGDEYIYLQCIRFILQVKTGSFFEHSPMLWDISGAKSWEKVSQGMRKMFDAEVLRKLPVMRHFLFGSLIPLSLPSHLQPSGDHGHAHDHHQHDAHGCPVPNADPAANARAAATTSIPKGPSPVGYRVVSCCTQHIPSAFAARELADGAPRGTPPGASGSSNN